MTFKHAQNKLSSYARFGLLTIIVGIIIAIDSIAGISFLYKLWPLLITLLGVGFVGIYARRSRREATYIGIGTYLIGFSGVALYCSLTTWTAMEFLWPSFIALLGISFVAGSFLGNRRPSLLLAGLLLISLAVLFFCLFALNNRLWWSVFVLAGISFLIFDGFRKT